MTNKIVKNNFDPIFERIKNETGLKSIRQLAVIIGKRQQTISAAKAKDEFSASWAYIVAKKYSLSTEWIMTGEGPKRLGDQEREREFPILDEFEEWLKEEVRRDPERKIWLNRQIQDAFPAFEKWKRKRDEEKYDKPGIPSSKVA